MSQQALVMLGTILFVRLIADANKLRALRRFALQETCIRILLHHPSRGNFLLQGQLGKLEASLRIRVKTESSSGVVSPGLPHELPPAKVPSGEAFPPQTARPAVKESGCE